MSSRSLACCLLLVALAACAEEKKQRLWRHDDDDDRTASGSSSASGNILDLFGGDTDASASASAAHHDDLPPSTSGRPPRSPRRKIDPDVEKGYRVEACLATAKILEVARDHYLESLKTAAPSASAIPKFVGSFSSRAHACRAATSSVSAKVPAIDGELGVVSANSETLAKSLVDAEKYYRDEKQKADNFVEGRALHETIVKVSDTRARREALELAFDKWSGTLPPPDTATWSKARFAARDYLATARTVSRLLEATPIVVDSVEKGGIALVKQLEALNATESDRTDRLLRSSAERFSKAVIRFAGTKAPARPELLRALSEYIHVVDAARMTFDGELSPTPRAPLRPRSPRPLPP